MISRFLAKVVITIVVLGVAAVELGSPLVVRVQLDTEAHDVADESARTLARTGNVVQAQATAEQMLLEKDASLRAFHVDTAGTVNVTVAREAPSLLVKKLEAMKSWYDVTVTAAAPKRGP